jgi:hypothetical protein
MANYLLTYYGGGMPESQEEQARVMEAWNTWFTSLGDAVVDAGNPTAASRAISPDGSVMDPASAPTGYTILSAADLDTAVDVAKGCPVLAGGASIVVSEILPAM